MAACEPGNGGRASADLTPIIAAVATRITISGVASAASARRSLNLSKVFLYNNVIYYRVDTIDVHSGQGLSGARRGCAMVASILNEICEQRRKDVVVAKEQVCGGTRWRPHDARALTHALRGCDGTQNKQTRA